MQIQTDRNRKERKAHGTYEFPVLVSHEKLSNYERRSFLWHWHTELEWTYVQEGSIRYQINDRIYHLKKGQGVLCNSNMLHMGGPDDSEDCHYVSITVHPRLLGGYEDSFLQKQYVKQFVENPTLSGVLLEPEVSWQGKILENLRVIEHLYGEKEKGYEFRIYLRLMEGWMELCSHLEEPQNDGAASRNMERLKQILTYIHSHYQEKITLEDIAREIHICSSECCRFFKRHMKESLFDYLLDYRIEQTLPLLAKGELSVTECAQRSGFSSSAYFSKVFRQRMGYTPREYQKRSWKKQGEI